LSPQVRLVCYPGSDQLFAARAMRLTVEYPEDIALTDLVGAVQSKLREHHPSATIVIGVGDGDEMVWHVYRDGA
jgi:hypothetical protein